MVDTFLDWAYLRVKRAHVCRMCRYGAALNHQDCKHDFNNAQSSERTAGLQSLHAAVTSKKMNRISYGGTAAIVTSMALITGLNAAGTGKATLITALLIIALAGNITDSLSIPIYQKSERLEEREAFIGTLSSFTARLLASLSLVFLVVAFPPGVVIPGSIVWGNLLLGVLTRKKRQDSARNHQASRCGSGSHRISKIIAHQYPDNDYLSPDQDQNVCSLQPDRAPLKQLSTSAASLTCNTNQE